MWIPVCACPQCRTALRESDARLVCDRCGARFPRADGIYRLLREDRRDARAPFLRQYRAVRQADGFRSMSADERRVLPDVHPDSVHAALWTIRARSFARLAARIAAAFERPSCILDLGAGNGWLSNRLASIGHHLVAVDLLDDEADGLGASRAYDTSFCAVQADFEELPFEPAQFDIVIFNASLHYAADPCAALAGARRMLREGGMLAVLDSPMFARERDGRAMLASALASMRARSELDEVSAEGRGFLTFADLARAESALRVRSDFTRTRGPLAWEMRRAMARARLGRAPAAFGVWIGR